MNKTIARALAVAPGQTWLSRSGGVIQVAAVDDDLVTYCRLAGTGPAGGTISVYSLLGWYEEVQAA